MVDKFSTFARWNGQRVVILKWVDDNTVKFRPLYNFHEVYTRPASELSN